MTIDDDKFLLREWVADRSHAAFRVLVQRYGALVWGVVTRRLTSATACQDAVQQVFVDLAQKATELSKDDRPLGPWLHRCAVLVTLQEIRRESRRSNHMKRYASEANTPEVPSETAVEAALPHLDEAIQDLSEKDRQTVLARFYHGQTYAQLAAEWGESVAAVQRRGHRALERLGAKLKRRGVVATSSMLTVGLSSCLTSKAPAGVLVAAHQAAVSAPVQAGGAGWLGKLWSAKWVAACGLGLGSFSPIVLANFTAIQPPPPFIDVTTTNGSNQQGHTSALPATEVATLQKLDLAALKRDFETLAASKDDAWNSLAFRLRQQMYDLQTDDIPAVYELLRSLPIRTRERLSGSTPYHSGVEEAFYGRWAEENAPEAVAAGYAMAKLLPGGYLSPLLQECFAKWALEDAAAAWKWMTSHAKIRLDWAAVYPGLKALPQTAENFIQSLGFVQMVPRDEDRRGMQGWLFSRWLQQDGGTASIAWAKANLTPSEASQALSNAISNCSENLEQIPKMLPLISHLESPRDRHQAISGPLEVWLRHAPEKAVEALLGLTPLLMEKPQGANRNPGAYVFSMAGQILMDHNLDAAVAAYRRLSDGAPQEAFLESMRAACPEDKKATLEKEISAQP